MRAGGISCDGLRVPAHLKPRQHRTLRPLRRALPMSFQPPSQPYLHRELGHWLVRNPDWYLRPLEYSDDDQYASFWMPPACRYAEVDEVAAHIVDDPALREALGLLVSP